MTDGYENSSCRYDYSAVKEMVQEREGAGWEFLFLAANIDAAEHSAQLGISADNAVDWVPDSKGQELVFGGVDRVLRCVRQRGDVKKRITGEFADARDDFKKRGGKNEG